MNSIKFFHFHSATEVTKNVYFCPALDNSNEDNFDTSNGNSIDLTELDEPSEKSEFISLNLIIKPSTGSASQSK
ncbi:uncharacterized protein OCT59_011281 [Rhizophagus irregularis]|uniref:Uncharacterized protein n=1 Tax=Rhizophagus irregularis TaxID=588596 RepID=A0A915ZC32_9GLOM|nr:hypothetical protein OCT59_011281 [Rhizophagus irregularis]CAB4489731.1 unnamed protein product [Rhizophagus irregularis]CAB5368658.1 unnamed protein product [Rhizophagus irregularis]